MSAIFPSAVATTLQLLTASNNTKVTLNVNAGIGDTTLTTDDASPLPTSGYVTFDDNEDNPETVQYTGKSGNNLTGVTRGADSTAAGTHSAGAHLEMRWNAAYHNTLSTEIIAVEQNLSDRIGVDSGSHVIKIVDGTVSAPGITFASDTDSGMYRIGANDIAFAVNGVKQFEFTTAGIVPSNTITMGANKITGLGAGTTAGDAVRFEQVLLLVGGTMTGAIAMGTHKITGLSAATTAGDALRYEQLFTSGTVTLLGSLAFNPTTAGIVGTTTNDSATAGNVGEAVRSFVTPAGGGALTSTVDLVVTSISLTAGDWEVDAIGGVNPANGTSVFSRILLSITGGGAAGGIGDSTADVWYANNGNTTIVGSVNGYRVSLASTTTINLVVNATWTTSTAKGFGRISARRLR